MITGNQGEVAHTTGQHRAANTSAPFTEHQIISSNACGIIVDHSLTHIAGATTEHYTAAAGRRVSGYCDRTEVDAGLVYGPEATALAVCSVVVQYCAFTQDCIASTQKHTSTIFGGASADLHT